MSDTVSLSDMMNHVHEHSQTTPSFIQTNLVSDGSIPDTETDPNLVNPWGVSFSSTSPFWISENGTGLASIDSVNGNDVTLNVIPPVTIPTPDGSGTSAPTGQVFNSNDNAFVLSDGKSASFLFATEDGTIAGWNSDSGPEASIVVDHSTTGPNDGAVYKGLAIANSDSGPMLYAANFRDGTVDVFDKDFRQVGTITDPTIQTGFAPFNVKVIDDKLYVTYAKQDDMKHDDVAGAGNGFIDVFDLQGHMLDRLASGGTLNSPWGLAIAPHSFGKFANDLLVGNFGDGTINVFNSHNDKFLGQLTDTSGQPIKIDGLWSLTTGNGGNAGDPNKIYFTAGPNDEMDGLFGSLSRSSGHQVG